MSYNPTSGGVSTFIDLTDTDPTTYSGQAGKFVKVNAGATGLEFATLAGGGDLLSTNNLSDVANAATARANLGVVNFTDELAQDAIGAMVDTSLVYTDATPLLQRAALTGAITASAGSNTTALGSFTISELNTAVSDGNVLLNTATSGVGTTPTSSTTTTITHGLGRTPTIIRISGKSGFTSNAAATPTTSSEGRYTSSGNHCIYQGINGTTTIAAATSSAFAIFLDTSLNNNISGVIQNVGATTFDIVWTETGTHTRGVYMWEAQ